MAETPTLWQVRQFTIYPELFFSELSPPEVQGKHVSLPQDLIFRGSAFETLLFFSPALSFTKIGILVTDTNFEHTSLIYLDISPEVQSKMRGAEI